MGKSGPKVKLPQYRMTIHYGICHGPLDSINQIFVKEKPIWCGSLLLANSLAPPGPGRGGLSVDIDQPDLFGGMDKEGGVGGTVEAYFGTSDQVMSDEIATRFGKTSGLAMPGYRGIANLFFRNAAPQNGGFYWIANNPYLPGTWVNVTRAPNPPQLGSDLYRYIVGPDGGGGTAQILPNFSVYTGGGTDTVYDLHNVSESVDLGAMKLDLGFGITLMFLGNPVNFDLTLFADFFGDDAVTSVGPPASQYDFDPSKILGSSQSPTGSFTGTGSMSLLADVPAGARWAVVHGSLSIWALGWTSSGTVWTSRLVSSFLPKWGSQCDPDMGLAGLPDANPAMMIFECLTNREWGMGAPDSTVDIPSFQKAAKTLFEEQFGLSMLWSQQVSIEKFITEILDHIQGTLFLDPKTGLWTLTLIRGDYNAASLKVLDPTNCDATNRQRKGAGEIINEVVISYKDADTEEDLTVTFQDTAAIASVGEIVSDTRNYYGVRNSRLANQIGARDIRSASYPLFSCDILADRSFRDVRPGSVLRLNWPEDGISEMVVRVMKVDYGRPGESRIKFNVVEDIFGLPLTTYTSVAKSAWESLDSPPEALTRTRMITAPLPLLLRSGLALSSLSDSNYPQVQNLIFGDDPNQVIDEISIRSNVVQPNGDVSVASVGTVAPSGSTVLGSALTNEASSTIAGSVVRACASPYLPNPGEFMYLDGDDSSGELLMLDSYNQTTDVWTVARGIFDTVPKSWAVGSLVWWIGSDSSMIFDPTDSNTAVQNSYFFLPRTGGGLLALEDATQVDYTPGPRPYAPFRPANTQIDGNGFGEAIYTDAGASTIPATVPLTWSNRNRTSEDTLAARWTEATVTEEPGQTTIIRVREKATGVLVHEAVGLAGTSYDLPTGGLTTVQDFIVEFVASRDGYESIQWAVRDLKLERLGYGFGYGYGYGGD